MSRLTLLIVSAILVLFAVGFYRLFAPEHNRLPIVAIANYGSHSSLEETIRGIKDGLYKKGFREGKTIEFEIADVNFDKSLITQMLTSLKAHKPKVIISISTPVSQLAKNHIKDIPVIFVNVTDPVEAGLLKEYNKAEKNITGASDTQDLSMVLQFAKKIVPGIKRVGMLYAIGEANDLALVGLMRKAADDAGMFLIAVPIESGHDIVARMHKFKDSVDMLYVGSSGAVQPYLSTIVSLAEKMNIPVFNMNAEEVKADKVFASYGVSHYRVGLKASGLISKALKGSNIADIEPIYPAVDDHEGFISMTRLKQLDLKLPRFLPKSTYVVK